MLNEPTFQLVEVGYWCVSAATLAVTIWAIRSSAFRAVRIGRQLNDEQNKYNSKNNLFLTLFTFRGRITQTDYRNVEALNQIDVVFAKDTVVLDLWHSYQKRMILPDPLAANEEDLAAWDALRASLLHEMSLVLGYTHLKESEILSHYVPQRHVDAESQQDEWRRASLKYYLIATKMCQMTIDRLEDGQIIQAPPIPES